MGETNVIVSGVGGVQVVSKVDPCGVCVCVIRGGSKFSLMCRMRDA